MNTERKGGKQSLNVFVLKRRLTPSTGSARRSGDHALARSAHRRRLTQFFHSLTARVCPPPRSLKTARGTGLHLQSVIDDGEHHQDGLFCLWLGVESDVQEKKSSKFGNSIGKNLKFIFNLEFQRRN